MMTDPNFLQRAYGTTDALKIRIRAQELYGTGTGSIFEELTQWALTQGPCHSVLDVGMGTGHWYQSLRQLADPSVNYTGLDASSAMVSAMHRETHADSMATVIQGDAQNLPFDDNQFDWVGLHFMLYHVPDPRRALQEAWRVTKPGGLVLTLAHGSDSLHALLSLHNQALEQCLSRTVDLMVHTYTLDHGSNDFPDPLRVSVESRPSGLQFPNVSAALAYYGSGFWQRGLTDQETADPDVKHCLFEFMQEALHAIIEAEGHFDVPGHSGWLWVRKDW